MYEMVSGATVEDIYDFYHNSGYYEVEWIDNKVTLRRTLFENNEQSNGYANNLKMDRPVVFEVIEQQDKLYLSCSVLREK